MLIEVVYIIKKRNFEKINFKYLKIAIKDDRSNLFERSNLFAPTVSSIRFLFFFFVCFLANQRFIFVIFSSVAPHRGQPAAKCHPKVATHQEIGSQLWAGETPDSNPGQQDNSLVRYH